MFQSFIISGGTSEEKRKKLFKILPFSLPTAGSESFIKNGVSNHPDFLSILPENSIGIEEIRNIEKNISLKPISLSHKIVIINDADKLTQEAQNALLKTLEEPPSYTFLFLLTKNFDLLLPTIISRCQIISLSSQNPHIIEKETLQKIKNLLSTSLGKRILLTDEILKSETSIPDWLTKIVHVWHQLLHQKLGLHPQRSKEELETLSFLSINQITKALKNTIKTKELIEKNINPKLAIDHLFLSWPQVVK